LLAFILPRIKLNDSAIVHAPDVDVMHTSGCVTSLAGPGQAEPGLVENVPIVRGPIVATNAMELCATHGPSMGIEVATPCTTHLEPQLLGKFGNAQWVSK
jgi:hypothetical protein